MRARPLRVTGGQRCDLRHPQLETASDGPTQSHLAKAETTWTKGRRHAGRRATAEALMGFGRTGRSDSSQPEGLSLVLFSVGKRHFIAYFDSYL